MSNYERVYGTDWDALDRDEAIDRAYALGVAASMGEYHPDELEAIREEMETSYSQSVVDLAFDEGKNEAREIAGDPEDEEGSPWAELVEGKTAIDADEVPTGGRDGLPEAIDMADLLDRPERDSTEPLDRPEFLDKD